VHTQEVLRCSIHRRKTPPATQGAASGVLEKDAVDSGFRLLIEGSMGSMGRTNGVSLGVLVVTSFAASVVLLCDCVPRFDDIPCTKDVHCPESSPYCINEVCSAVPSLSPSVDAGDAGADDGGSADTGASDDAGDAGNRGDAGTAVDSGTDAGRDRSLGAPCLAASECASGHCATGVCCESACDEAGKLCQRCDSLSQDGLGHCGMAKAEAVCLEIASACSGRCLVNRTVYYCTGNSYACSSRTESVFTPVPSGQICTGDGGVWVKPVDRTASCGAGGACQEGACQGTRWWTSCNGSGACRSPDDSVDALKEPIFATPGASLTSACETNGKTTCDNDKQCVGDALYGAHLCGGSGVCSAPAGPATSCGKYTCDGTALQCKAQCTSNTDCAKNWLCTAPRCHWNWDWIAWDVRSKGGYAVSGEVVTDSRSGLMWQRGGSDAGMAWDAGIGYCDSLDLGGYSDWRLPKTIELLSLVDPTRVSPAVDVNAFPDTQSRDYWTSTPSAGSPGRAWTVDLGHGWSSEFGGTFSFLARCVR
jgi:hypothetical protein